MQAWCLRNIEHLAVLSNLGHPWTRRSWPVTRQGKRVIESHPSQPLPIPSIFPLSVLYSQIFPTLPSPLPLIPSPPTRPAALSCGTDLFGRSIKSITYRCWRRAVWVQIEARHTPSIHQAASGFSCWRLLMSTASNTACPLPSISGQQGGEPQPLEAVRPAHGWYLTTGSAVLLAATDGASAPWSQLPPSRYTTIELTVPHLRDSPLCPETHKSRDESKLPSSYLTWSILMIRAYWVPQW